MTVGVLEAVLRIRDEMTATLAKAGVAVRAHEGDHANLDRQMGKSVMTGTMLGNVLYNVASAVATTAFSMASQAIIGMNSELETSTMKFTTLTGNAEAAKQHVADLFEFAKKTPFETGPVIQASVKLQTFGGAALDTKKNLTLLGDASAATGAPINELGFWVGRMYAAIQGGKPFGEAAMRLQELAVMTPQARDQMEQLQKSGAKADVVFAAFQTSIEKFSGAMVKQAGTWTGVTSTLKDVVNLTIAGALKPLFEDARDAIGGLNAWLEANEATTKAWGNAVTEGYQAIKYVVTTEVMPVVMSLWALWKSEWALMAPAVRFIAGVLLDTFVVALRVTEVAARALTSVVDWLRDAVNLLPQSARDAAGGIAVLVLGLWGLDAVLKAVGGSAAWATLASTGGALKVAWTWVAAFGWDAVTMGFGMFADKVVAFAAANPIGLIVVAIGSLSVALKTFAGASYSNQIITLLEALKDGGAAASAGYIGRKMAEDFAEAAKNVAKTHSGLVPMQTMVLPSPVAGWAVPPSFADLLSGPQLPKFNLQLAKTGGGAGDVAKHLEDVKKAADGLFGVADITKTNLLIEALGGIKNVSKLTAEGLDQLWKAFAGGQAAVKASGGTIKAEWAAVMDALSARELDTSMQRSQAAVEGATAAMGRAFGAFAGTIPQAMFAAKNFDVSMAPLAPSMQKVTNAFGTQIPYTSAITNALGQVTRITDAHGKTLKVQGGIVQESTSLWQQHAVGIGRATEVVDTLSRAAEMSGHKTTAALLSAGSALAKSFASGGVWGAVITGIGLAITGLVKLFSKSEGKKVNDLRDTFFAAQGGYEALHQKLIAANNEAAFYLVWNAKTQKEWDAGLVAVNAALDAQTEKLAKEKQLTADIAAAQGDLAGLRAQQEDWSKISGLVEKYHINLDALGPKIQQLRLTSVATTLLNDYEVVINAGGEAGVVLDAMKGQISTLVQESLKFATTIPENMRPMIEALAQSGGLLDANGNKIVDIASLKWGAKVETEADRITAAIEKLVLKLGEMIDQMRGLPATSQAAADKVAANWSKAPWSDWGSVEFPNGNREGGGDGAPGFIGGTYGRFLDFGKGTPVTLHGYERVVTEAEGRAEAGGGLDLGPLLAELRAMSAAVTAMPSQVARATRDAVLIGG